MGNYIKVPNSDFSLVSVDKVTISEDPIVYTWAEVDLSKITNQHFIVYNEKSNYNNGYCYGLLPNNDAFLLPVTPGERFKIRCCNSDDTYIVCHIASLTPPVFNGDIIPYTAFVDGLVSLMTSEVTTGAEKEFTIPDGCNYIYVSGRNSGNPNFVTGFELKLYKYTIL